MRQKETGYPDGHSDQRYEHNNVHGAEPGLALIVNGRNGGLDPTTFAGVRFETCMLHV